MLLWDPTSDQLHKNFGAGHGLGFVLDIPWCDKGDEEGASALHQHNCIVRDPQGRPHICTHTATGEASYEGAAGQPTEVRWLHPLVPPWLAGHMEWVCLWPHCVEPSPAADWRSISISTITVKISTWNMVAHVSKVRWLLRPHIIFPRSRNLCCWFTWHLFKGKLTG